MKDMKSMKLKLLYIFYSFMFFMCFMVKVRGITFSSKVNGQGSAKGDARKIDTHVIGQYLNPGFDRSAQQTAVFRIDMIGGRKALGVGSLY
jgi:hypothetical protein